MERGDAGRRASASAGPEGGETVILRRSLLRSGASAAASLGETDILFVVFCATGGGVELRCLKICEVFLFVSTLLRVAGGINGLGSTRVNRLMEFGRTKEFLYTT